MVACGRKRFAWMILVCGAVEEGKKKRERLLKWMRYGLAEQWRKMYIWRRLYVIEESLVVRE